MSRQAISCIFYTDRKIGAYLTMFPPSMIWQKIGCFVDGRESSFMILLSRYGQNAAGGRGRNTRRRASYGVVSHVIAKKD